jgi:hypothetical protein
MALSDREIREAREKLRLQYEKYTAKYGSVLFSYARVDERYMQSLKERLPPEHFLANEVRILKELEKMAEEKLAPPPEIAPSNADRMLEEFAERIRAYPLLEFSRKADEEAQRLAGALADFYENWGQCFPRVRAIPPGTKAVRLARALESRLYHHFEASRVDSYPPVLFDLAMALERITTGERERERLCKVYLKESGFVCNLISELLDELIEMRHGDKAGVYESAKFDIDAIIHAFRLREFRLASL